MTRQPNSVIIVDIDGTVADNNHRNPFAYDRAGGDGPIWPIIRLVKALARSYEIVYMTGRKEWSRPVLEGWLDVLDMPTGELYMRADDDERPDQVAKPEMFEKAGLTTEVVELAIDDRLSVITAWRAMGLTVLDVAGNTF